MTTFDLSFRIDTARKEVSFAGLPTSATLSLASNVQFVNFDRGAGQIHYNDRPKVPEIFTDPSPYQGYINQWITAMALASPALTLAQAIAAKTALLTAIYAVKRQLPASATVTAGTYSWDTSDSAMARMTALAGFMYVDPLNTLISGTQGQASGVNSIVSTLNTLVTDLNGRINSLNGWASLFNSLDSNLSSSFSTLVSQINSAFNSNKTSLDTAEGATIGGWTTAWTAGSVSATNPAVASESALSGLTEVFGNISSSGTVSAPTLKLIPVGTTSPVTLSPTDLKAVMTAIAAQNLQYQQSYATKQAALAALTTISAVASYDTTTGW